jgi:competence ComEA-like helix-hairpin-helix protein
MRRGLIFSFVFLFLIAGIYALCEENQIDINSASSEELDKLDGIGPVKAQSIIDSRPFDSVGDLIDVPGIGEITLEKIKSQNLACVENSDDESHTEDSSDEENSESEDKFEKNYLPAIENISAKKEIRVEKDTIFLAPKDIKTASVNEDKKKINYPLFGLIFFGVLVGFLYLIKEKGNRKNEFKE